MKCPENDIKKLIDNCNTGIEYEYGVACALMTGKQYTYFFNHVVSNHLYKDTIIEICNSATGTLAPIIENMDCKEERYISFATQDDSLGPSDILVCCNNEIEFGISVKYGNINNWNPSSRWFIDEAEIPKLRNEYAKAKPKYIKDMQSNYGECKTVEGTRNTWSRKRSKVTDAFIDLIREKVIENWSLKSETKKQDIINGGYQLYSPIDYYVMQIKGANNKCKISSPKPAFFSVQDIKLNKCENSGHFVCFEVHGKTIVKLQVKFNNGFLQKIINNDPINTRGSFLIDEIYFKDGDPFGSYNFNIL